MKSRRLFLSAALSAGVSDAAGCASIGRVEDEDFARIAPAQPVAAGDKITSLREMSGPPLREPWRAGPGRQAAVAGGATGAIQG
jgi:hypothetical protein